MTHPEPNITVKVDVTNPGQFFACCGLLELADRLWPDAEVEGCFTVPRFERSSFCIFGTDRFTTPELIIALINSTRTSVDPYRHIMGSNGKPVMDARKTKPVMFREPISLRLSWWLDELAGRQTDFKLWGAHQTSEGLIDDMAQAICPVEVSDETVLQLRVGMTGRIGLDTRSSWNTLDAGFSPNDQTMPVDTYPATELLAAIGLQTFRPAQLKDGYMYASWSCRFPVAVARAAASGGVNIKDIMPYRFEIGVRGKFKFFTKAFPLERNTHG